MAEVLKVSIQGYLPSGEVWTVNPVYQLITEPAVTWDNLNTVATAINALIPGAGIGALWTNTTGIKGVKLEARFQNGTLEAQIEQDRPSISSGSGSAVHPGQTSMVLSLRTPKAGPQGRGRLYFPATGVTIAVADLRPTSAVCTAFLSAAKTYLSGISSAITPTLGSNSLVVWSRVGLGAHGVNRLLAGNVLDVQRRRRDTLIETYSSITYP